jgi:hypothetical protein
MLGHLGVNVVERRAATTHSDGLCAVARSPGFICHDDGKSTTTDCVEFALVWFAFHRVCRYVPTIPVAPLGPATTL